MASISLSRFTLNFSGLNSPSTHKAGNELKLSTHVFPKPSRRRLDLILSKASITDQSTARRTANHHPNLWNDDFIHSLPKAYESPFYAERAERLIREVKEMFDGMSSHNSSAHQRLSMVDNVERLGIDRHFQKEIKEALDYVYRYWNDKGIGNGKGDACADLNTTALGLRILRLHRYGVSSGVLENFKGKDGQFLSLHNQSDKEIKTILNLFRASLIAFPREKVMEEAKAFATRYLKQVLPKIDNSNLSQEIEFNLEYGWHTNVPRLETRNYIDIYGADTSWWWIKSRISQLAFACNRYVKFYFWAAGGSVEPKYSAFRTGFAKIASLATVIDDIYDTYGTLDELKLFTDAIKRWDSSSTDCLPKYMKVVFMAFYEMVNEMAQEAIKTQGRDTLDYARKLVEAARGEEASCVRCYIRDNPKSTEEEALDYLNSLNEELLKELMWENLKKDNVPTCTKDHAISLSRGIQLFYKERDGFSVATKDIRDHIVKILVQHVTM